jgi:hypothetical protein
MAATSTANSAKIEYSLAASENRDAMASPKKGYGNLQFSHIGKPERIQCMPSA